MITPTAHRELLDSARCACGRGGCEHDPLFFHSRCHPDDPTWAAYANGVLTISCATCDTEIVKVPVASKENARAGLDSVRPVNTRPL